MKARMFVSLLVWAPLAAFVAPSAPASAATAPPSSTSCLDACFKQLSRNLNACRKACWICEYSVLGICLSGHHDVECFTYCSAAAREVHEACVAGCGP